MQNNQNKDDLNHEKEKESNSFEMNDKNKPDENQNGKTQIPRKPKKFPKNEITPPKNNVLKTVKFILIFIIMLLI
jgi:hypothetical protein